MSLNTKPSAKRAAVPPRRHTQAVIIIHGMGEQRPMDTLRRFADAVLPEPDQGGEKYFSRPDPLSESFELRVLQDRSQPRTHFYEYYWADKVSGTSFRHVTSWLTTLLFRMPGSIPRPLFPIWLISWSLIITSLIGASLGVFEWFEKETSQSPSFMISAASLVLLGAVQGFILNFIGDVARYLNPSPENIKIRQAIRADGIKLLKKIHEEGIYERVILVGHSLGSFVAYDILTHVWQSYYKVYEKPGKSDQKALSRLESLGEALRDSPSEKALREYMDAQIELWKELRGLGNPWLVTDFISMGSPLAHAVLALAKDEADLQKRQRQRELPTNPPVPEVQGDKKSYSYRVWEPYGKNGDIFLHALHSAALFAVTRWTNLYFKSDRAGGPITAFGPGVRNIPVVSGSFPVDHTILAHTSYWSRNLMKASTASNSIAELVRALDLKNEAYFR